MVAFFLILISDSVHVSPNFLYSLQKILIVEIKLLINRVVILKGLDCLNGCRRRKLLGNCCATFGAV